VELHPRSGATSRIVREPLRRDPAIALRRLSRSDFPLQARWLAERVGFRLVGSGLMTPDNPVDDERHVVCRPDREDTL